MLLYRQVFDITRKVTYKNLAKWYKELRDYRENIPCIVIANKIDGILLRIFVNKIVICHGIDSQVVFATFLFYKRILS